jgi:serine/threonine-protein phosphatase CPPED1
MQRVLLLVLAVGGLSAAALVSGARPTFLADPNPSEAKFVIEAEAKNPWTGLAPNADPAQFQFVVVSDRTGGHRKGVFSRAVQQVNLLQPEFVMSVGDLIEGSAGVAEANRTQWDEFDKYAKQFTMPFFYCAGNHDAASATKTDVWGERLGKRFYHFVYKDSLFLVLNSNDMELAVPNAQKGPTVRVGRTQQEYVAKALNDNPGVKWTYLFIHHPIWAGRDLTETGWLEVEKSLTGRKYTVFCGHVHSYRKFIRNGMNYYQLATTGGGSALRGIEYGEFDQVAWVTQKNDGPVIANVLLDGVLKDDLLPFPTEETGGEMGRSLNPSVVGKVFLGEKPAVGVAVTFTEILAEGAAAKAATGNARVMADGSFMMYGPRGATGLKAGRYVVTFNVAQPIVIDGKARDNPVPEKYRQVTTTPYRVEVKADGKNEFTFKIEPE